MGILIWDGLDRPRVGVICEYRSSDNCGPKDWTKVHVLALGSHGGDQALLLAEDENGRPGKMFGRIWHEGSFRPLRTPEQIAAEERCDRIYAIEGIMLRAQEQYLTITQIAAAIDDAGYRNVTP